MMKYFIPLCAALLLYACVQQNETQESEALEEVQLEENLGDSFSNTKKKLSEYGYFKGDLKNLEPIEEIIPYDIATPLFSDYAYKARFVKFPKDSFAQYKEKEVLDFPDGTVLIKNFYYPLDFRKAEGERRIIETRLLTKEKGTWEALVYVWNAEQSEAFLEIAGKNVDVFWTHYDGSQKKVKYAVPNLNQCKGCHSQSGKVIPIGPNSRQLNKDYPYTHASANQLEYWKEKGYLQGLHASVHDLDAFPIWENLSSGTLGQRARAYLDINCAHCHNAEGPANTSGLLLDYYQENKTALGIFKSPVAAGRGSGGLKYDILPGQPDSSILLFRMDSEDPGIMMPELGKKMRHTEAIDLIREWISSLN